jgi:hypothetical protein
VQPDIVHDLFADPAFKLRRKIGAGRLTEVGQIIGQG